MRFSYACAACCAVVLAAACDSGSSSGSTTTSAPGVDGDDTLGVELVVETGGTVLTEPVTDVPDGAMASGGAGLVLDTRGDCGSAGDTVSLALFSRDAEFGVEAGGEMAALGRNVTAYTEFALQSDSTASVEVLSHGDTQFDLVITTPDIIGITARFLDASVTDFIAAWPADAPTEAVLVADRGNGTCLYSMRLPGYCGTLRTSGADVSLAINDTQLAARGCEIIFAPDLPLIRLE